MPREIKVYDTTLRDGTQGEGVSFSMEDKVRIAQRLDALGIHYIEGGWPGSNPKDLRMRPRPSPLNVVDAKGVEPLGDADLVLHGEGHALALGSVSEGGVVDLDLPGHEAVIITLPRPECQVWPGADLSRPSSAARPRGRISPALPESYARLLACILG